MGLITLAIAGLTAGALLLWKNWNTVWGAITGAAERAANFLIEGFNRITAVHREGMALLLTGVRAVASVFSDEFAAKVQVAIDALRRGIPTVDITKERVQELGSTTQEASTKMAASLSDTGRAYGALGSAASSSMKDIQKAQEDMAEFSRDLNRKIYDNLRRSLEKEDTVREEAAKALKQRELDVEQFRLDLNQRMYEDTRKVLEQEETVRKEAANRRLAHEERVARLIHEMNVNTAKSNESAARINATAIETLQRSMTSSWASIRDAVDPILSKLRDAGVGVEEIVRAWASSTGRSADTIVTHLQSIGIKGNDIKAVFFEFANSMGLDLDRAAKRVAGFSESVKREIESAIEATRRVFSESGGRAFRPITEGEHKGKFIASDPGIVPAGFDLSKVIFAQHGARISSPGPVVVGERGPELLHLPGGSSVSPMGTLAHGGGGIAPAGQAGASFTLNMTVNGDVTAEDFYQKVQRAVRDTLNAGGFPQLARV